MKAELISAVLFFSAAAFCANPGNPALNRVNFETPGTHAPLELVRDGEPEFVILFDRKAEAYLTHPSWKSIEPAVEALVENMEKAMGQKPVAADVSEAEKYKDKIQILVGESPLTKALGITASKLPPEGFAIKSFSGGIAIVGNDSSIDPSFNKGGPLYDKGARRATLWGAYDFLERFFGCRFYYPGPDGSIHPKVKNLKIDPVSYTDSPHFRCRGTYYLTFELNDTPDIGKLTAKDQADYYASQRWAKTEPFTSMHSPYPIPWAKANPGMIESSFFRNSNGHLYQSFDSHSANYFDVTNLKFADNLIDSLKRYYANNGKEKQGWGYNNGYYIAFGQCDNELQLSEMQNNETVKKEGLITEENIKLGEGAYFSDVYGRFYQYFANRIAQEFPGKKLIIMPYAGYTNPPLQKKYMLPDNVELGVCLGKIPRFIRNPEVAKTYLAEIKSWSEAIGDRPVQQLWTYNAGNNCFSQAVATEMMGEIPKLFGKYLGNVEIFHEFGMWPRPFPEVRQWHFFYETYVGMRAFWNPDFDVDAALNDLWINCFGPEAGEQMRLMHEIIRTNYLKYGSAKKNPKPLFPPVELDKIEACLKKAEKLLPEGTAERRRFEVMARPIRFELKSQRGQHAYQAPTANVRRLLSKENVELDGKANEPFWEKAVKLPMLEPRGTGNPPKFPADLRLVWNDDGLYALVRMNYQPKTGNTDMWNNSVVEFFLSPGLGKEIYFQICFDPDGKITSMKHQMKPFVMAADYTWKYPGMRSASLHDEKGWTMEVFFPFSGIVEKAPRPYQSWNFNFVNNKMSEPTEASATSMTLGNNHNPELYGSIKFLGKGE